MRVRVCISVGSLLFGACASPVPAPASKPPPSASTRSDQQSDWAEILKVEEQAKAIVRSNGCTSAGQCRTAAVGNRACGGPRYYLTYCAATTDTAQLTRLLERVRSMENAYNAKWGIVSTCEYRVAPKLRLSGGFCQEIAASP